jgi:chitodextrinase
MSPIIFPSGPAPGSGVTTPELFDNATAPGTSTFLTEPVTPTDQVINVRGPASIILQTPGGVFRIIVVNPTNGDEEIMLVTAGAWSATWTVTRAIENTGPAKSFPVGSPVRHILTRGSLLSLAGGGVADISGAGGGSLEGATVDTNQLYKILLFSNGTLKAIPASANPPAAPVISGSVGVAAVNIDWPLVNGAVSYNVYKDGALLGNTSSSSYLDRNVTLNATYNYTVRSVDQYGQPSILSNTFTAFIDPTLNHHPTVAVTVWPNPVPGGSQALVRVGASDIDYQTLAMTLGVNHGQLQPTADNSIWILTAS